MRLLVITQAVDENDPLMGFFTSWLRELSKHVEHLDVLTLKKGKYDLPENVQVFSLGKEKGRNPLFKTLMWAWLVSKLLPKANGVFVHMAPEYVRAIWPWNFFFRKPIVMWYSHIKISSTALWALKRVKAVCTASIDSYDFSGALAKYKDKVFSTGHGIDTNFFSPPPSLPNNNPKRIVAISRISYVKRIEDLIETAAILKKEKINFVVEMYGAPSRKEDNEYLSKLKKIFKKNKIEDLWQWRGSIVNNKTPDIYRKADIFVRMQGGGGYGKTELEAMSCGLPITVPTKVYRKNFPGFAEDITYPEKDIKALVQSIKNITRWETDHRTKFSRDAREYVLEKHNIEILAK